MEESRTVLNKEQIFAYLSESLEQTFEIPAEDIRADARLYEDLDIDSLDAVDLVIQLRDRTGVKVQPEQFKDVRTVGDVVDAVHALIESAEDK